MKNQVMHKIPTTSVFFLNAAVSKIRRYKSKIEILTMVIVSV